MKGVRRLATGLGALLALGAGPSPGSAQAPYPGSPRLMQGPMVGAVSPGEIPIWIRASGPFPVQVEYDTAPGLATSRRTPAVTPAKSDEYTAVLRLADLRPGTRYFYRVLVNGEPDRYQGRRPPAMAHTAPPPDTRARFRVAFGSCARYQSDPVQEIWEVVERLAPDLFLWTGDNIYGDALDPDILEQEYQRQRDVPSLQPVLRSVPQLAIWDDHDYGLNDHDRNNPVKREALRLFRRYWANPSSGLPDSPGVFFRYGYGGVDFFFLDVRYQRDPNAAPDLPGKTMLGSRQLEWLRAELQRSAAPFKVLVSGSGWTRAKGPGGDSWASFLHERDSLFEFIRRHDIGGVVLLSGDTHVGELNAVPWSERGGYDFYDLVSSPLAQSTTDSWLERTPERRIRPVYFAGPNVGVLEFDLAGSPVLRYTLVDQRGNAVGAPLVLTPKDLSNGVESWRRTMDPEELRRWEAAAAPPADSARAPPAGAR